MSVLACHNIGFIVRPIAMSKVYIQLLKFDKLDAHIYVFTCTDDHHFEVQESDQIGF